MRLLNTKRPPASRPYLASNPDFRTGSYFPPQALSENKLLTRFQATLSRFKLLPSPEVPPTVAEELTVIPTEVELSGDDTSLVTVYVRRRRPCLGWTRRFRIEAKGNLSNPQVELKPETQLLELRVAPLVSVWAQLAGLIALLLLAIGVPKLLWRSPGHTGPVRTVRFNGPATELVSGSDDRSILRWQVRGNRLVPMGTLAEVDKAVRVLRYRPFQNTWVAAGYENSSMQMWNLLSGSDRPIFAPKQNDTSQPDDRVFDLAFEPDSRILLSGHGSGSVYRWQLHLGVNDAKLATLTPELLWDSGFAIQAISFAGENRRFLAAAGQFNRVDLWDFETSKSTILYRGGSSNDTFVSLAVAESQPDLLAASDSQGYISVWDLNFCWTQTPCQPANRWQGHNGLPVRSLAFSDDGCFLVSGGDDGRIVLWQVDRSGILQQVRVDTNNTRTLGRSRRTINTVDVARFRDHLLVASGGDDRRVRLHEYPFERELQQQNTFEADCG